MKQFFTHFQGTTKFFSPSPGERFWLILECNAISVETSARIVERDLLKNEITVEEGG